MNKVLYIAANGHSGSTLLDIIIGKNEKFFSTGELTFIARDTIRQEYCSCGRLNCECKFWSKVWKEWLEESPIDYPSFQLLRTKYEPNKKCIYTLVSILLNTNGIKLYRQSLNCLLKIIHKNSGKSTIIDSSKSPLRVLILYKIADIQVIHLTRNFTGVLNSSQRSHQKNVKAGIEEDKIPRRKFRVFIDWILNNLLITLLRIKFKVNKVSFTSYIQDLTTLSFIDEDFKKPSENYTYSAKHMIAGNRNRLKKDIKINKKVPETMKMLSTTDKVIAKLVDKIFYFWC